MALVRPATGSAPCASGRAECYGAQTCAQRYVHRDNKSTSMNPIAPVLLAALACGQASGQSIEAPPEARLRLYVETRPG